MLNFAIIGAGNRGIHCFGLHIENHPDAQLVALCDPNEVRAVESQKILGGSYGIYTSLEKMLDSEKLDGVIVTSPDYCHTENALALLSCNIPVLIDKPLATSVADCQKVIATSEEHNALAMMGFNLRRNPVLLRLKEIIDSGVLGRVFLIENREFYDGGKTYMARWNRKREFSGGLWIHKGSHDFDVFAWLLGSPKPIRVSATAAIDSLNKDGIPFELKDGIDVGPNCCECAYKDTCKDVTLYAENSMWDVEAKKNDGYSKDVCIFTSDKDVHDNGIAIVDYENGVRASHMECFVTSVSDRRYTVIGDRGQAEVSLTDRTIKVVPRWKAEEITYTVPEADGGHGGSDPRLVNEFIVNIQKGITGNASLNDGLWATAVGEAAEIASREHRTVNIKDLFDN